MLEHLEAEEEEASSMSAEMEPQRKVFSDAPGISLGNYQNKGVSNLWKNALSFRSFAYLIWPKSSIKLGFYYVSAN